MGEKTIGISAAATKIVYTNYYSNAGSISVGSSLETINGYTTDYSSLGSYFLKYNIDANGLVESNEVCYIVNNNLFCLKGGSANYYVENKNTLLAAFDSIYCYSSGNGFGCSIAAFNPFISLNGEVYVSSGALSCSISSSGLAKCAHVGPA